MMIKSRLPKSKSILLRAGVSLVSLSVCSGLVMGSAQAQSLAPAAQPAPAADSKPADSNAEVVVVIGTRKALASAQKIKKDSDTVVDSITATDIGSFPDKSVAESLQRVPGVEVSRYAQVNDTRHYTGEASGVIIRGLPDVGDLFNGRDSFSANSSRGLSWEDVTPELMSGVDVYKAQTASLIEGGISGTINLKTRLPFDQKGQTLAFTFTEGQGSLSKATLPSFSGLYSNRWRTNAGEFGLLVNLAHSSVDTSEAGTELSEYGTFAPGYFPGQPTGTDAYLPTQIEERTNLYKRQRTGEALAAQWKSNDGSMLATLQYNRSDYKSQLGEHDVIGEIFNSDQSFCGNQAVIQPTVNSQTPSSDVCNGVTDPNNTTSPYGVLTGTPNFTFAPNGDFLAGTVGIGTPDVQPYPGNFNFSPTIFNSQGQPFFTNGVSGTAPLGVYDSNQLETASRVTDQERYTQDVSGHFKWTPTPNLALDFDAQYIDSQLHEWDMEFDAITEATMTINLAGKYPSATFDTTYTPGFNLSPGGVRNPDNYTPDFYMDHTEDDKSHEAAFAADGVYKFTNRTWLNDVKFGARYSDRQADIDYSAYNFQFGDPIFAGWAAWAGDKPLNNNDFHLDNPQYPSALAQNFTLPSNVFGAPFSPSTYVGANLNFLQNMSAVRSSLNGLPAIANNSDGNKISLICSDTGTRAGETIKGKYGCYLPSEVNTIQEQTSAIYGQLDFGGSDAKLGMFEGVTGNVGVRVITTVDKSTGYNSFPVSTGYPTLCATTPATTPPTYVPCSAGAGNIAFSNGAAAFLTDTHKFTDVLPSFNIKLPIFETWQSRVAIYEGINRPDFGLLRNYSTITSSVVSSGSNVAVTYNASRGNPDLLPTKAWNYDWTLENYFAQAGSFTLDVFYKDFSNYDTAGSYYQNVTNNGATELVKFTGPINGKGANIAGAEIGFNRFFDFLPSPFDGLGFEGNYTVLKSSGITNTHLDPTSSSGTESPAGFGGDYSAYVDPHALIGVSDTNYNLVGKYEKGPHAFRLAYTWRSQYLVTDADCCSAFPIWQKAQGLLDASYFYKINPQMVFGLLGTNILGAITDDTQQISYINGVRRMEPYIKYEGDKRLEATIRLKY